MPNPTINFRISPEQLAKGLWIIKQIQPDYSPTSYHQIVKLLYIDYLDKMDIYRTTDVPSFIMAEIEKLLNKPKKVLLPKDITLSNLPKPNKISSPKNNEIKNRFEQPKIANPTNFDISISDDFIQSGSSSDISTVTDFSTPTDWMDD